MFQISSAAAQPPKVVDLPPRGAFAFFFGVALGAALVFSFALAFAFTVGLRAEVVMKPEGERAPSKALLAHQVERHDLVAEQAKDARGDLHRQLSGFVVEGQGAYENVAVMVLLRAEFDATALEILQDIPHPRSSGGSLMLPSQ